ncbi:hypothetical protein [Mycoplasma sp. ATU-Cv-508]|uniref:hypothetical protein n=1 Tax=Mycoplasma sp. ATU-Cv-508 TaxID=2048001 RepID=UPI000FDD2E28
MSTKDKVIFIFLSIITLGIFPAVVYWRGRHQPVNQKLSTSEKISVDVDELRRLLGGLENLVGAEFTHTKVKIFVKERRLVQTEKIKKTTRRIGSFCQLRWPNFNCR